MDDTHYTREEYRAARINNDAEYEAACERADVLWQRDQPSDTKEWWLLQAVIREYEIRTDKAADWDIEQD